MQHNWIRGCDAVPGAWTRWNGQRVTLFGSTRWKRFEVPGNANTLDVDGAPGGRVWLHERGLLIRTPADGRFVSVETMRLEDGRMIKANKFGADESDVGEKKLELRPDEKAHVEPLRATWSSILGGAHITDETNFFDAGATSADLTRLVEETRSTTNAQLANAEVKIGKRKRRAKKPSPATNVNFRFICVQRLASL